MLNIAQQERRMLAVTYDRVRHANEVLSFTEIETPSSSAGEVRVKLASSGVPLAFPLLAGPGAISTSEQEA